MIEPFFSGENCTLLTHKGFPDIPWTTSEFDMKPVPCQGSKRYICELNLHLGGESHVVMLFVRSCCFTRRSLKYLHLGKTILPWYGSIVEIKVNTSIIDLRSQLFD